jgi:hypothetical protein
MGDWVIGCDFMLIRRLEKGGGMLQNGQTYTIRIRGHLSPRWSDWFDGMEITHGGDGQTILSGVLPDQSALFGLLYKIRDLGLTLVAVECGDHLIPDPQASA